MSGAKFLLVLRSIIINNKGESLLLKRTPTRNYNPGKWELPGGKIIKGENIESSLEKIINKETNLYVSPKGTKYYVHGNYITEEGKYKNYNYFEICTLGEYLSGEVKISNDHESFAWVPFEKLLEYDLSLESKKAITKFLYDKQQEKDLTSTNPHFVIVSRAIVQNERHEILLLKRNATDSYENLWEIPGGKLTAFESLNEHLIRETLEETGLVVEVNKPNLYVYSFIPKEGKYKGITFINIINGVKIKSGEVKLSNEHSEYRWVKRKAILDYDIAEYMKIPLTELFFTKKT